MTKFGTGAPGGTPSVFGSPFAAEAPVLRHSRWRSQTFKLNGETV